MEWHQTSEKGFGSMLCTWWSTAEKHTNSRQPKLDFDWAGKYPAWCKIFHTTEHAMWLASWCCEWRMYTRLIEISHHFVFIPCISLVSVAIDVVMRFSFIVSKHIITPLGLESWALLCYEIMRMHIKWLNNLLQSTFSFTLQKLFYG